MRPIAVCQARAAPAEHRWVCGLCGMFGDLAVLVGRSRRQRQSLPEQTLWGVWRYGGA